MRRIKTGILGLALSSFIGNAWAADVCARAQDLTALQAAAVQQELMVAAFACNQSGLYNSFVVTYQKDLQNSDQTLQDFFLRLNEKTGAADYHTFKTRLANSYSLRSSGNEKAYCGLALKVFRAALNEGKKTLAEFVLSQQVAFTAKYDSCGERIEGGAMLARAPAPELPPGATLASAAAVATAPNVAATLPTDVAPSELPAKPDAANASSEVSGKAPPAPNTNVYSARNSARPAPPPQVRRYEARDRYARDPYGRVYGDSYGYSNRYGERDPYYRNPYDRYWYGAVPDYYYLRRR
ncbi:MAG TPA: hypothetical protein VNH44_05080 [Micropepsaceae bacterium]|nr:hypothetical protein [Micropepsaceae bacterium]